MFLNLMYLENPIINPPLAVNIEPGPVTAPAPAPTTAPTEPPLKHLVKF